jgi:hypothetical protein
MYSNIESDDIFASAMEEAEIVENPFAQGAGDGEPLHALDAARRLLDEEEDTGINMDMNMNASTSTSTSTSISNTGAGVASTQNDGLSNNNAMGNSLLERIQQQKMQQGVGTNVPVHTQPYGNISQMSTTNAPAQVPESTPTPAPAPAPISEFGYPMVEEGNYSSSGNAGVRIPEYSQVPAPSAYNTDSTTYFDYSHNAQGGGGATDYKGKMMSILSTVGNVAGTAASSAYNGTKSMYEKMSSKNANTGLSSQRGGGGGSTREMDYQRESLLMDPHDLEDRALPIPEPAPATSTASTSGMRAGIISGSAGNNGDSFLTYVKHFVVDIKDLFMSASTRVQIGIIVLMIFIIWLIFFE